MPPLYWLIKLKGVSPSPKGETRVSTLKGHIQSREITAKDDILYIIFRALEQRARMENSFHFSFITMTGWLIRWIETKKIVLMEMKCHQSGCSFFSHIIRLSFWFFYTKWTLNVFSFIGHTTPNHSQNHTSNWPFFRPH